MVDARPNVAACSIRVQIPDSLICTIFFSPYPYHNTSVRSITANSLRTQSQAPTGFAAKGRRVRYIRIYLFFWTGVLSDAVLAG